MSYESTDYREKLAEVLNNRREQQERMAYCTPGNDLAREGRDKALGYIKALNEIAADMGLKTRTRYTA